MLKEDFVLIAQQRAKEYSKQVQKQRKQKKLKKVAIGISMTAFFVTAFGIVGKSDLQTIQAKQVEAKEITTESEQKYIVRYGTMGNNLIVTKDGNTWSLIDGPEYSTGTEVRVLFDSMETDDVTDDIIIDITER